METALRSSVEILAVLFSDTGAKHMRRLPPWIPPEARLLRTTDRLFAFASGTETPQGVAALVRPRLRHFRRSHRRNSLDSDSGGRAGSRKRGHAGAHGGSVRRFRHRRLRRRRDRHRQSLSPKALRASAGSALRLPIARGISAPVLLAQLRIAGVRVYAACPDEAPSAASCARRRQKPRTGQRQERQKTARAVGDRLARARGPADRQRRRGLARRPGALRRRHRAHSARAAVQPRPRGEDRPPNR